MNTNYLAYDGLGSVRQLTDSSGSLLLAQTFDPYGNLYVQTLAQSWAGETSFGFTGEMTDDNGLIYLRARYYNPATGSFTQRDPFGGVAGVPLSLNPYLYAHGAPVMYTDPSGEVVPLIIGALIFVGVSTVSFAGVYATWDAMVTHRKGGWENVRSGAVFHSSHYADIQDSLLRSTARGAGDGIVFGLSFVTGFATAGAVKGGALTARGALAITSTVDIAAGTAADYFVYGDPLGQSLAFNAATTLIPEAVGYGIGKVARKFAPSYTLLIGEGNFSYARSLVEHHGVSPKRLIATSYETLDQLRAADDAAEILANIQFLRERGVRIVHGVDARRLQKRIGFGWVDELVWNFPHDGGDLILSTPRNKQLLEEFFGSAPHRITPGGKIVVTMKDTPFYKGWRVPELAEKQGLVRVVDDVPFHFADYPGYKHRMTRRAGSADIPAAIRHFFGFPW